MVDGLAKLTGVTQAAQDTKNVNAESAALNAKSGVLLSKNAVTDTDAQHAHEEAAKANAELEAALAAKRAEASRAGSYMYGGLDTGTHLDVMSDEQLRKASKENAGYGRGGQEEAAKYMRDKEQLAGMTSTLDQLNAKQAEVADKIATKTLRVVIVGDTRPAEMGALPRGASPEEKARKK